MIDKLVGFADEETARRALGGIVRFEKSEKRRPPGLTPNSRGFVRVTGSGTSDPAPPAVFGCFAGEIVAWADAVGGYEVTFTPIFVIYLTADGTPATGDILEADFVWNDDDGVSVWLAQQGSASVAVDNVHVVGQTGQSLTVRRVTLDNPAAWPPVESSPVVEYTGVYESENRDARIIDSPGTATHIIPLYRDADGNHYVVFWKTCTFDDLTLLTDVNLTSIVQNADCSFTIVMTKTYDTKRWYVDVNPPGNPDSGLRLRIDTQANLPDVCGTEVGAPMGLLLALTKSL